MKTKIQVLIVDDNQETRDGTRRLLEYEDDIEIVDFAENGLIAIDKVREHVPDVVLMDINMPEMDGITATQRIQAEYPRVQVIVVSVQNDPTYMREAIRAGAVDFVEKPISADELAESIRRAYRKAPPEVSPSQAAPASRTPVAAAREIGPRDKSGKIITVLGPKGGSGKSTVAVNLGVGLARSDPDKAVLVIDGDVCFGDVGVFLNTIGQYSIVDMARMAEVPEDIDHDSVDTIISSHESGIKLLTSPSSPADEAQVSVQGMVNTFEYLRTRFDYIVIDTAVRFDNVLVTSIQAADRIVLLTAPTMPALKDARVMLGELMSYDYSMNNVLLVVNEYDPDGRITTDRIGKFLRKQPALEIPYDPMATEALNQGVPLIMLDGRRVPSVQPLKELVRTIREAFERTSVEVDIEPQAKPRRRGLLGSLRG